MCILMTGATDSWICFLAASTTSCLLTVSIEHFNFSVTKQCVGVNICKMNCKPITNLAKISKRKGIETKRALNSSCNRSLANLMEQDQRNRLHRLHCKAGARSIIRTTIEVASDWRCASKPVNRKNAWPHLRIGGREGKQPSLLSLRWKGLQSHLPLKDQNGSEQHMHWSSASVNCPSNTHFLQTCHFEGQRWKSACVIKHRQTEGLEVKVGNENAKVPAVMMKAMPS